MYMVATPPETIIEAHVGNPVTEKNNIIREKDLVNLLSVYISDPIFK